jgi:hypothetical protein
MNKLTLSTTITLFLLCSCASRYYIYDVSQTYPAQSKKLEYSNDTLTINFDLKPKYVEFTLLNRFNDGIKINWDEVSLSINGKAKRIVHKETGVYKITDVQPPTTIPPKSSLKDMLIPSSNVKFVSSGGIPFTVVKYILPVQGTGKKQWDEVKQKYIGTKITVFLPIYIAGKYQSYYYDFMINDVILSKSPRNKK